MHTDTTVEELLKPACPSIKYRIRREIFNESISTKEMKNIQKQILQDDVVRGILNSQDHNGWLGKRFHGYDSMEAEIRLLCEKGVSTKHSALANALLVLETSTDRIIQDMGTVGRILDEWGLGGTLMMRATIFAYAKAENKAFMKEQIKIALEGFRAVLTVESIDDIVELYRGKLVFRPGVKWPSIYHLRLLAFTHSWRIPQHQKMVVESVKKLIKLSPIPSVKVRFKSQIMAPASFGLPDFNPAMTSLNAAQWMMWFHQMELLSRLDVVRSVSELRSQVNILRKMLDNNEGWFTKQISHDYFTHWGAYTGLMLERDWRISQRRIYDLTFRCLLIRHYSKI